MDENAEFQSTGARLDEYENSFKAEHYRSKLASCPASGSGERRVHRWILSAANLAQSAKVDFADWSEDVIHNATRAVSRTELVEAWAKAGGGGGLGTEVFSRHPEIKHAPLSAAEFIKRGFGAAEADLLAASPVRIDGVEDRRLSACALLRAVFLPGELVYCGFTTGGAVLERDDWISRFMAGEYIPPLFCANPLKAGGGLTANGVRSPRCDDAVAVFRHAVAEMDSMPLADHYHPIGNLPIAVDAGTE